MKIKLFFIASAIVLLSACSQQPPYDTTKSVIDCQGNTYPVVKIGEQYWMAENLKCTKYDTESEKAGQILTTSETDANAPYYTDGRQTVTGYSDNLTEAQREKLGLLYNIAAAGGFTEFEAMTKTGGFGTQRQGICPNGFHLPTIEEWDVLAEACGGVAISGKKLKTTTGWYEYDDGTDYYGFAALPAGFAYGSNVYNVGEIVQFWSSNADNDDYLYYAYLYYNDDELFRGSRQDGALSVRCIRNN